MEQASQFWPTRQGQKSSWHSFLNKKQSFIRRRHLAFPSTSCLEHGCEVWTKRLCPPKSKALPAAGLLTNTAGQGSAHPTSSTCLSKHGAIQNCSSPSTGKGIKGRSDLQSGSQKKSDGEKREGVDRAGRKGIIV